MDKDRPAGQTVTQQNATPWAGQQPYMLDVMNEAQNQYRNAQPQFFPDQAVVPHSAATTSALGLQENRALAGSPLRQQALQHSSDILSGQYLNQGNPHTQGLIDRFNSTAGAALDSRFARSKGRFGSEGHAEAFARGLGDSIAPQVFGNYENERARQFAAMQGAPGLAATDYDDYGRLAQVGGAREELGQRQLDEQIARQQFNTNLPNTALGRYAGYIQGIPGFQSQETVAPYYNNRAAGALGGAVAGGQVGNWMGDKSALWPLLGAGLGYL